MKAGVRTMPCAVAISPARAAPSVAISWNENEPAIPDYLSEQQASVAIRVKAVITGDGGVIGAAHDNEAAKCANKHEQGRARQMKICQHRVDGGEAIPGRDEKSSLAGKRSERAVIACGAFEKPQRGRADGDDPPAGPPRRVQICRGLGAHLAPFRMHFVAIGIVRLDRQKGARTDMQRHAMERDASLLY